VSDGAVTLTVLLEEVNGVVVPPTVEDPLPVTVEVVATSAD
jgi:hypothetical protein